MDWVCLALILVWPILLVGGGLLAGVIEFIEDLFRTEGIAKKLFLFAAFLVGLLLFFLVLTLSFLSEHPESGGVP